MKRLIIVAILLAAGIAAASGPIGRSTDGQPIQGCKPVATKDAAITGNSQTINVTSDLCWMAYVASDAKFRTMSTATKAGVQHTIPGALWHTDVVGYKFLNISGAAGTIRRQ